MIRLGFHVPISGGWRATLAGAVLRRCTTCQVFTSSPVQWAQRPLDAAEAAWFAAAARERDIQPLFVHAAYLLNISTPERALRARSVRTLASDVCRAGLLRAAGVVLHLGSVGERGRLGPGLKRAARSLDEALEAADGRGLLILENCAGAGNTVGCTIEQIGAIIGHSTYPAKLRFCLDTAHAFASGYPVHSAEGLDAILALIDHQLGPERLVLIHANDTQKGLGSRADRHWHVGQGSLGREGFRRLVNHPRLGDVPFIMETPGTVEDDIRNMMAIRRLIAPERRPPLPAR